jgi:hypothetical protein
LFSEDQIPSLPLAPSELPPWPWPHARPPPASGAPPPDLHFPPPLASSPALLPSSSARTLTLTHPVALPCASGSGER